MGLAYFASGRGRDRQELGPDTFTYFILSLGHFFGREVKFFVDVS